MTLIAVQEWPMPAETEMLCVCGHTRWSHEIVMTGRCNMGAVLSSSCQCTQYRPSQSPALPLLEFLQKFVRDTQ